MVETVSHKSQCSKNVVKLLQGNFVMKLIEVHARAAIPGALVSGANRFGEVVDATPRFGGRGGPGLLLSTV